MSERVLDQVLALADQLREQAAGGREDRPADRRDRQADEGSRLDPAAAAEELPAVLRSTPANSPRR